MKPWIVFMLVAIVEAVVIGIYALALRHKDRQIQKARVKIRDLKMELAVSEKRVKTGGLSHEDLADEVTVSLAGRGRPGPNAGGGG